MSPSPGFTEEARENVVALESGVLALEAPDPSSSTPPAEHVAALFRAAHNLKGMAAMEELDELATVAHRMETVLDHHRRTDDAVDRTTVDVLLAGCDALSALVEAAEAGVEGPDPTPVLATLDATIARLDAVPGGGDRAPGAATATSPPVDPRSDPPRDSPTALPDGAQGRIRVALLDSARLPGARAIVVVRRASSAAEVLGTEPPMEEIRSAERREFQVVIGACDDPAALATAIAGLPEVASAEWEPAAAAVPSPGPQTPEPHTPAPPVPGTPAADPARGTSTTSIRVDVERLDELADAVGELTVNRNRLAREVERSDDRALSAALRRLNRTISDLQLAVMGVRLVSLEATVERARRLVRDVSRDLGKEVTFTVEGEGTEIDRSMVDEMVTPLVHLLRNAVDHGIESVDARHAAGKPAAGDLRLRAYHQGSQVVVEVSDDGAGIDLAGVAAKAVRLGLQPADEVRARTEQELIDLMFTPGFSTREEVSEVSGRGVGLDVVRSQVTRLGGDIDVRTRAGRGTTFRMRLPLSLAVADALLVAVADQIWAIPVNAAVETTRLRRLVGGVGAAPLSARHRDELIPVIHGVEALAGLDPTAAPSLPPHIAVVFDDLGRRFALTVDDLVGSREIVVKPVPALLAGMEHLAGVTVLPDGTVGLIADLPTLARRWRLLHADSPALGTTDDDDDPARSGGADRQRPDAALPVGLRRAADTLAAVVGHPVDIGAPRVRVRAGDPVPSLAFAVPLVGEVAGELCFVVTGYEEALRSQGVDDGWHATAVSEWANMLGSQFAVGLGEALGRDVRVGLPSALADAERPERFGIALRAGATVVELDVRFDDRPAPATPR